METIHFVPALHLRHGTLMHSVMAAAAVASPPSWKVVKRIMPAPRAHWVGNGFQVFPVFANLAFTNELSPWLMFDYAAPKYFKPTTERLGVGQHPHRGFETVTIAFQGGVEHSDSMGHKDVIGAGDVQWMTAGRGIIHEEYHSTDFAKTGGTFEMCQLWLNLPAVHKMHAPRYQPILSGAIPVVPLRSAPVEACATDGKSAEQPPDEGLGSARIIAGELYGTRGPAHTFSDVELWDLHLPVEGRTVLLHVPEGHNTIIFVRKGMIALGGAADEQTVGPQGVALLTREGTAIRLTAKQPETQVLLLGGKPLDEPIATEGPFVMNSRSEIMQARMDYQNGKMGR